MSYDHELDKRLEEKLSDRLSENLSARRTTMANETECFVFSRYKIHT